MILDYFSEHFHILADVPNSIQKLRELILQLAVQGKLVLQDPKEEPASILLKKVRAEKEKLINVGKIKKSKPLSPIDPDDEPYELPESWEWVRLGELGRIIGGGTPRTNNPAFFADTGIPWLTPADLYELKTKTVARGKRDISELGLAQSSAQLMPAGTVLFSSRAPIGYVAIAANDLATNQGFKSCVPFIVEMNEYIYYFLMSAKEKIDQNATGTTFREISGKGLSLVLFPIPPIAEQKRIAAKVDQLMALCDELESHQKKRAEDLIILNSSCLNALTSPDKNSMQNAWQRISNNFDLLQDSPENVSELRQAILQLAVQGKLVPQNPEDETASMLLKKIKTEKEKLIKEGKINKTKPLPLIQQDEVPYELPEGWEWAKLGEAYDVRDGTHDTPKYVKTGYPLVTSKNIYGGKLDMTNVKYISESDHRAICQRSGVDRMDILFAMIGSIGNPVIVDLEAEFSIKNVALFKYYDRKLSLPKYLRYYLSFAVEEMKNMAAGGVQAFVSLSYLRNYLIPIPPFAEQERIVAKVDQLMALCDELEVKLKQTQSTAETLIESVVNELTKT